MTRALEGRRVEVRTRVRSGGRKTWPAAAAREDGRAAAGRRGGNMRVVGAVLVVLAALAAVAGVATGDDAGFVVIVNSANPAVSVSRADLGAFFLKQSTTWPDGQVVLPVDQAESSPVRADFSQAVLKRPVSAVKSFWQKQIFSGAAVPPIEKGSNGDVAAYVGAFHGAVGYVGSSAKLPAGVKAVRLTD